MPRSPILRVLAIALLLAGSRSAVAQDPAAAIDVAYRALASGNARALVGSAPGRVEIALFGATRRYSRAQAEYVMADFFAQYPTSNVAKRDGAATQDGWFGSFLYRYERGALALVVYVRLRRAADGWVVTELIVREAD